MVTHARRKRTSLFASEPRRSRPLLLPRLKVSPARPFSRSSDEPHPRRNVEAFERDATRKQEKRGENDDDLWETPTFSLTDKRVRALARLSGLGIPEYVDEPEGRQSMGRPDFWTGAGKAGEASANSFPRHDGQLARWLSARRSERGHGRAAAESGVSPPPPP